MVIPFGEMNIKGWIRFQTWSGGYTYYENYEMARNGVTLDLKNLKLKDKLSTSIDKGLKAEFIHDITGEMVDIGAYLSGEPECMITTTERVGKVRNVVNILFNGSANCGISHTQMVWKGIATMGLIDAITHAKRYRLNIFYMVALRTYRYKRTGVVVKLADSAKTYDAQALGYVLTEPGMLRKLFFGYCDGLPDKCADAMNVDTGGYGKSGMISDLPKIIKRYEGTQIATKSLCLGEDYINNYDEALQWINQQIGNLLER